MAGRNTLLDTASQERNDKRNSRKSNPLFDIIKRIFGGKKKKKDAVVSEPSKGPKRIVTNKGAMRSKEQELKEKGSRARSFALGVADRGNDGRLTQGSNLKPRRKMADWALDRETRKIKNKK